MDKDAVTKLAVPLAKDVLSQLLRNMASNAASNVLYKLEKNNWTKRRTCRKQILFINLE